MNRLRPVVLVAAVALLLVPAAGADAGDERVLAEKYAPVVRLAAPARECGDPGEPFQPTDIDLLLGEETVGLRGPWNRDDLVKVAPTADDLVGRYEHHLDFPGDALDPGCTYAEWSARLIGGTEPVVYAHVASEVPGKLALQYWLYYVFNDFNNTHEGDWEMIQLVFDADDAREALTTDPVEVGYSAHEGAERSDWSDELLERVEDTHPVVYPAAGSHANKYEDALWLGASAEAGVGCDDTRGPHRELRPRVETIPSDPAAAAAAYPWIAFEGRWGERQKAFFNGPRGPNLNDRWTRPIEWSESWRERGYAVPAGGILGTSTTDFFCSAVETGSRGLMQLLRNPGATLMVLAAFAALLVFLIARATWTPVAPFRFARRRTWGQTLSAAGAMYVRRPRLFLGIGLLAFPLVIAITLLQWILFEALRLVGLPVTGETAGSFAIVAVAIGATLALFTLGVVMAATVAALVELDEGRDVDARAAYRLAFPRRRGLLSALAIFVAVWLGLSLTTILIPVALWFAVRWALVAPVVQVERLHGRAALQRSAALVHGRWLRVGTLVAAGAAVTLLTGPLLGALLIFVTAVPLAFLNFVAGVVYALALPFVALVTAYVYADARARNELEREVVVTELPAEIALTSGAPSASG